jgi:chromosomal replication initiation ATPase DnaA
MEYKQLLKEIDNKILELLGQKKLLIKTKNKVRVRQIVELYIADFLVLNQITRFEFNRSRAHKILPYRNSLIHYLREKMTLKQVGRVFKKDHSTILHALKEVESWHQDTNHQDFVMIFNEVSEKLRLIENTID